MPKAETAFSRHAEIHDTTIGWRFVNPLMKEQYGVDSMPETGENVAEEFNVSRAGPGRVCPAQPGKRLPRRRKTVGLRARSRRSPFRNERAIRSSSRRDEHPRATTLEALAKLTAPFRKGGTVTAGNASGVNDGAAALILASEAAAAKYGLIPMARVLGGAAAGVPPRIMGIGPAPASRKLMVRLGLSIGDFDVIEINEAFASQGLASLRELGVADDDLRVNPNGGAIALGHPLGMSGARITGTAALELALGAGRRSLSAMCIGVGQGIAIALEKA